MKQQTTRRVFVAPQLKEEASLVDVTLLSGGHSHGGCNKGPKGYTRGGRGGNYGFSGSHGHGGGRYS